MLLCRARRSCDGSCDRSPSVVSSPSAARSYLTAVEGEANDTAIIHATMEMSVAAGFTPGALARASLVMGNLKAVASSLRFGGCKLATAVARVALPQTQRRQLRERSRVPL